MPLLLAGTSGWTDASGKEAGYSDDRPRCRCLESQVRSFLPSRSTLPLIIHPADA